MKIFLVGDEKIKYHRDKQNELLSTEFEKMYVYRNM